MSACHYQIWMTKKGKGEIRAQTLRARVTLMFTRPFPIVCEFLSFFSFSHQDLANAISGIHHLLHSTRTPLYSMITKKCHHHLRHQPSQQTKRINTHGQYLLMYITHTHCWDDKFIDLAHYPPLSDTCYLYKNAGTTQLELSKVWYRLTEHVHAHAYVSAAININPCTSRVLFKIAALKGIQPLSNI